MKKLILLICILLYLSSSTIVVELYKLPVLVSHYIEHKTENNSITFYTFLYQHYQTDDGNDMDNARDEQLPFKSQDLGSSFSSQSFGIPHSIKGPAFSPPTLFSLLIKENYKEPFIPSACLNRIWQPPKFS